MCRQETCSAQRVQPQQLFVSPKASTVSALQPPCSKDVHVELGRLPPLSCTTMRSQVPAHVLHGRSPHICFALKNLQV